MTAEQDPTDAEAVAMLNNARDWFHEWVDRLAAGIVLEPTTGDADAPGVLRDWRVTVAAMSHDQARWVVSAVGMDMALSIAMDAIGLGAEPDDQGDPDKPWTWPI